MSEIKVNKISPKQTCTQLTLGDSGDTIIIPAGATIQNLGTATGFGATGAVNWDTTPKTTTVTAVSGTGYFVNTTAGAITVNLPAGTAGSIVAISDYANTAATNNITISPNGTDKINGVNSFYLISTNGAAITLIYIDGTRGWKDINDATLNVTGINPYVLATGGTITTCGNYKIHTFTGPGTFTVTCAGTPVGSNTVDYLVVAGGAGGGNGRYNINNCGAGGGGGAGGFRESVPSPAAWTASPLANPGGALPVSVQGYPITVGGGGSSPFTQPGVAGNPSTFSTITSTGGGGGGAGGTAGESQPGLPGGSGGGAGGRGGKPGGSGNTPPTSPSQGNSGGTSRPGDSGLGAGGGGGATAVGAGPGTCAGGNGGNGAGTAINSSPTVGTPGPSPSLRYFAGGGGGTGISSQGSGGVGGGTTGGYPGASASSAANSGGGSGGTGLFSGAGGSGGSGIVIIRYKFQ